MQHRGPVDTLRRRTRQCESMRPGKSTQTRAYQMREFTGGGGRAHTERQNAASECKEVLNSMVHLPQQQLSLASRALKITDIARNFGRTNDFSVKASDRGHR